MDIIEQYTEILAETLPEGFRINKDESVCDNGMPKDRCKHYEDISDKSNEDLDEMAQKGELFGGLI